MRLRMMGLGLGLVMVLLPACSIFSEDEAALQPEGTTIGHGSTLGDVTEDTSEVVGEIVSVDGEVKKVLGSDTFKLEQEGLLGGNDVLVVNANPDVPIKKQNWVRVTGVVRKFVSTEIEKDYNLTWDLDFKETIKAEYENQPVIFAESVELLAVD
ncbi:hypothetical protein [Coleofasciculus sp. G1-WW12-02]|uniref:hypothetical protein n=1 Tax=unclassified Coleofasciculus TaxID=2692782 RepID=UPI003301F43D